MTTRLLVGDVFERMAQLDDGSFDLIVTSPPFLALRSYLPDGHPDKAKEIGSEATPAVYLDTLLALTAEWRRLLAPHGSIAIELGDTYSGSGGAGGDYNPDGLREGQPSFDGSGLASRGGRRCRSADVVAGIAAPTQRPGPEARDKIPGWPLDKSLTGIPTLYAWSLAYGRNLLTGQPSPAGRWRIRNVKPWIRSNPPVGALGDKERPATSYITVACTGASRWFDLDAVRTPHAFPGQTRTRDPRMRTHQQAGDIVDHVDATEGNHPGGAPPLDWWHHVDAIIDAEIDARAGKASSNSHVRGNRKAAATDDGQGYDHLPGSVEVPSLTVGARGVHIRRALEKAGILTTLDAYDVSPKGYAGAHYAVWPPELVKLMISEMCPRQVCRECGVPSRRIVGSSAHMGRQPELAAHLRERRLAAGFTMKQINDWFPGKSNWSGHWEDTTSQPLLPTPEQWAVLRDKLNLDPEYDSLIEPRSTVEYLGGNGNLPPGQRRTAFDRGGVPTDGTRTKATRQAPDRWSDCGHGNYRHGRILDPFVGSGTTLAVASGMGRDSVGIDLDERSADLARERCGMFLEVDYGDREVPA